MSTGLDQQDTIVARATAAGAAAVAVIRLSGADALRKAEAVAGGGIPPRLATLRTFKDSEGAAIDQGLVIYFPAPHSFTGEDVVEFQCHGGGIVVDWLLETLHGLGARPARAGEFSQRAFLNDKIDLTQAEAVADLIASGSRSAARAALRSLEGRFAERVNQIQSDLTRLRVLCEAWLDFPDEDIDPPAAAEMSALAAQIESSLASVVERARAGVVLSDGMTIAIAGEPNAGKSTLLNRLSGIDAAIVSDVAGTTRDTLHRQVVLGGLAVELIDTAGIRDSDDTIERAGVARARDAVSRADRVLWVADVVAGVDAAVAAARLQLPQDADLVVVLNKIDLLADDTAGLATDAAASRTVYKHDDERFPLAPVCRVSALTGQGVDELVRRVSGSPDAAAGTFSARRRHLAALERACSFTRSAAAQLHAQPELAAEDLRGAQTALAELTGEVTSDDLLGEIFSTFCIGK